MQTPPDGRQAIKTEVLKYSNKIVKKIINTELKRKGQVYFLHNRVQTIEAKAARIKKTLPESKNWFNSWQNTRKKIDKNNG